MRTVKLVIGYEGTRYEGWQSQLKGKTVQELFEKALERILKERVNLVSSSRTDSGVHAEGLVAHFRTHSKLPDSKIKDALNYWLPADVLVCTARTVDAGFHARYSAKSKHYRYVIWNSRTRPLFEAPFVLWYPHRLDPALMRRAARHFVGTHDFAAFKDRGDEKKTTVRRLRSLRVTRRGVRIHIDVVGDGFLTHMVRIIAGTLIDVGRKNLDPCRIPTILASKDRRQAGPTAKALALTLVRVRY